MKYIKTFESFKVDEESLNEGKFDDYYKKTVKHMEDMIESAMKEFKLSRDMAKAFIAKTAEQA